jgi:hypothetical protein
VALLTPAAEAMSAIDVPANPRFAKRRRAAVSMRLAPGAGGRERRVGAAIGGS